MPFDFAEKIFFIFFSNFTFFFSSLQQNGSRYHLQIFLCSFQGQGEQLLKKKFYVRHLVSKMALILIVIDITHGRKPIGFGQNID